MRIPPRKIAIAAMGIVFFLFLFIAHRKAMVTFVLAGISAAVSYYKARHHIQLDFTPVFFFSIFITNYAGFSYSLAFIIFSLTVPGILGGEVPDAISVLFWGQLILLNLLSRLIFPVGFVTAGVILAVLELAGSFSINKMLGRDPSEFIFHSFFAFAMNVFYFVGFGRILVFAATMLPQ